MDNTNPDQVPAFHAGQGRTVEDTQAAGEALLRLFCVAAVLGLVLVLWGCR